MKKISLAILVVCCLGQVNLAQVSLGQDSRENAETGKSQSSSPPPTASSVTTSPTGASSKSGNEAGQAASAGAVNSEQAATQRPPTRRSSGRQISPLKPLKTMSGTMPGFMQRAAVRNSQQAAQAGQQNTGRSAAGTQQSLQQVFLNNALLFDENSDNRLAANELKNLFILLVSENNQNTQNNYYGFNSGFGLAGGVQFGGNPNFNQVNRNLNNQGFNQPQNIAQTPFVQTPSVALLLSGGLPNVDSASLQEAILLFLLLTLQFDTNGDGALNQAEIQLFATALLNNQFNLNPAANASRQIR